MDGRRWMLITTFMEVLALTDVVVYFVLAMTMTYLTNVWGMSVLHAGAVVNVASGAMEILPCVLERLTYGRSGILRMAIASAFSSALGLALLAMSVPSVLSSGNCSHNKSECIGHQQKNLLFFGLAFASVGGAAYRSSLEPMVSKKLFRLYDEVPDELFGQEMQSCSTSCSYVVGGFSELGLVVLVILLQTLDAWSPRFLMAAIVSAVGFVAFIVSGPCCHEDVFEPCERQFSRNKLWFVSMIPFWLSYIAFGVLSAAGNTYFSEQANTMKPLKIGHLKIGFTLILLISLRLSNLVSKICSSTLEANDEEKDFRPGSLRLEAPFKLICYSMIVAILCCITAASVEARRLHRVATHGLADMPDKTVPMSVFWMMPQLLLLGISDGMFKGSAHEYVLPPWFVPKSATKYAQFVNKAFFGVGTLGASASVYFVGKASERGGTSVSWIQHTINHSRLDNYYWVLATYSSLNFLAFLCIACYYLGKPTPRGYSSEED